MSEESVVGLLLLGDRFHMPNVVCACLRYMLVFMRPDTVLVYWRAVYTLPATQAARTQSALQLSSMPRPLTPQERAREAKVRQQWERAQRKQQASQALQQAAAVEQVTRARVSVCETDYLRVTLLVLAWMTKINQFL
jgi:hypothetical protein